MRRLESHLRGLQQPGEPDPLFDRRGQLEQNCRATLGRVEVCNGNYGNTGWLGIAGIYLSGTHITKGYVKVNDTYFNTATYNTPEWRQP